MGNGHLENLPDVLVDNPSESQRAPSGAAQGERGVSSTPLPPSIPQRSPSPGTRGLSGGTAPRRSRGEQVPAASPAAAAGPRPARHELASARHRLRQGLTQALAGCHAAKLLTNSSGCLPASPGAAAPSGERDLEGVVFQAVPVVIPPCQRTGQTRIIRRRVENETGVTGETRCSA